MRRVLVFAVTAALLGGCTTTSFAPPPVDLYQAMNSASLSSSCQLTGSAGQSITDDVAGARSLIKNYYASYDCAMRAASNGRQWFEVPAFAALVGATSAVALGAGPHVALIGQSANSVFTAGNNYYAPREQASILRSAIDAISCIEAEASHINATQATTTTSVQKQLALATGASVSITAEQQYHDLIESRLHAINGIAAERLSKRGSLDAAGVAAQVQKAADDLKAAKDAKNKNAVPLPAVQQSLRTASFNSQGLEMVALQLSQNVQLDIDELQPKLDLCVARATS